MCVALFTVEKGSWAGNIAYDEGGRGSKAMDAIGSRGKRMLFSLFPCNIFAPQRMTGVIGGLSHRCWRQVK